MSKRPIDSEFESQKRMRPSSQSYPSDAPNRPLPFQEAESAHGAYFNALMLSCSSRGISCLPLSALMDFVFRAHEIDDGSRAFSDLCWHIFQLHRKKRRHQIRARNNYLKCHRCGHGCESSVCDKDVPVMDSLPDQLPVEFYLSLINAQCNLGEQNLKAALKETVKKYEEKRLQKIELKASKKKSAEENKACSVILQNTKGELMTR